MTETFLFHILNFAHSYLLHPRSGPGPAGRGAYLLFGASDSNFAPLPHALCFMRHALCRQLVR